MKNPSVYKGLVTKRKERIAGSFPYAERSVEEELSACYEMVQSCSTPLQKYLYLQDLHALSYPLFFKLVEKHTVELVPLIYTPVVGEACQKFSHITKEYQGLFLNIEQEDEMEKIFKNFAGRKEVQIIVVTDGERILGLGDLGVGGMGISMGKSALYTIFAGIDPAKTLPVVLDVGTNNEELLNDPLYVGIKKKRAEGERYKAFIDRFVKCVQKYMPQALLQWEDFERNNARNHLKRYRKEHLSFNDDIQGTAAISTAALLSAMKASEIKRLSDHKFVFFGAGSAGIGIADLLTLAMQKEGLSAEEAKERFYFLNRNGLIHEKGAIKDDDQRRFARSESEIASWKGTSLLDTIVHAKATVLIGTSTQTNAFTEEMVRALHKNTKRPIIFPLSNPTAKCEAKPEDLLKWTNGDALVATGSPFDPVKVGGFTLPIAQCNNSYIFPGIGLGAIAAQAKEVTEEMFLAAAEKLASFSPLCEKDHGCLLPPLPSVKKLSQEIALAVGLESGYRDAEKLRKEIAKLVWEPTFESR